MSFTQVTQLATTAPLFSRTKCLGSMARWKQNDPREKSMMKIAIFYLEPNMTHVQDQESDSGRLKLQGKEPNLVSGPCCGIARTVAI